MHVSPALSQVWEPWDHTPGPAEPDSNRRRPGCAARWPPGPARLSGSCTHVPGHVDARAGGQVPSVRVPRRPPPGRRTCDGVQGRDGQHEDGGDVEVPAQTDVDKECPCVQVDLGNGRGTCAGARGDRRTQAPLTRCVASVPRGQGGRDPHARRRCCEGGRSSWPCVSSCAGDFADVNKVPSGQCPAKSSVVLESGLCLET